MTTTPRTDHSDGTVRECENAQTAQLAQLNVGRLRGAVDDPIVAEFMGALDQINALADRSPGFVWRFQTVDGNATSERPFDDDEILVNFSTWESVEALSDYVYRSDHTAHLVPEPVRPGRSEHPD